MESARTLANRRLLAEDRRAGGVRYTVVTARTIAACSMALLRCCGRWPWRSSALWTNSKRLRAGALGESVGQPGWLDRARLWRPLDFLGERAGARGPLARERLRPPAGVDRHQRLRRSITSTPIRAFCTPETIAADRADRGRAAAVGRAGGDVGRFRQPEIHRRARYVRSAGSESRGVVESEGRTRFIARCPISAASS